MYYNQHVSSLFKRTRKRAITLICALFFSAIFICAPSLQAAPYNNAAALRLEAGKDGNSGFTFKHFFFDPIALEVMLLSDMKEGVELSGLCEYQSPIPGLSKEFYWFAGAGLHAGSWGEKDQFVAGVDAVIGIEYVLPDLPMAIGVDWHPVANFISEKEQKIWPIKFGVSLRYCF